MGNQNARKDDGFDPKFMEQHNRKMQSIRGQYTANQQFSMPGAYHYNKPQTSTLNYSEISRKVYLYKPSIDIDIKFTTKTVIVEFQYDVKDNVQANAQICLGVKQIRQDKSDEAATHIQCNKRWITTLNQGEKQKYREQISLNSSQIANIENLGVYIKIMSSQTSQASQYSLLYIKNQKLWKVAVQIYFSPINKQIYHLEDIYGGSENEQECIICFSEQSSILVKPCNHLCLCQECSQAIKKQNVQNCPICRKRISGLVKLQKG